MALLFSFADDSKNLRTVFSDLELLKGKRKGQTSIRVNDQFRLCFFWQEGKIYQLELVDYHDEPK